jgi:hypothetical protein
VRDVGGNIINATPLVNQIKFEMESFLEYKESLQLAIYDKEILTCIIGIFILVLVIMFLLSNTNARKSLDTILGKSNIIDPATLILMGIIWLLSRIQSRWKLLILNRRIIGDKKNLTVYKNEAAFYFHAELRKFRIYKRCDFSVNKYYWKVQSSECEQYYTQSDDEKGTLDAIMKGRMREFGFKMVNDYFEFILLSYLCCEHEGKLEQLRKEAVRIGRCDDVTLVTQGHRVADREAGTKIFREQTTPDITLSFENSILVIDAYDGSSEKEMKSKLAQYSKDFSKKHYTAVDVFCFSSSYASMNQFATKPPCFKMHSIAKNGNLEEHKEINFGSVVINIEKLNNSYLSHYEDFRSEVYYWLRCDKKGEIIQTKDTNK